MSRSRLTWQSIGQKIDKANLNSQILNNKRSQSGEPTQGQEFVSAGQFGEDAFVIRNSGQIGIVDSNERQLVAKKGKSKRKG